MRTLFAAVAAVPMALFGFSAQAADVNLLCKTEFTRPDGTRADFLRQYEITFATGQVVAYDNLNGQFTKSFSTNYVKADNKIIIIAQNSTVYHEINRVTGMAFSMVSNGELKRGICSPSAPLRI